MLDPGGVGDERLDPLALDGAAVVGAGERQLHGFAGRAGGGFSLRLIGFAVGGAAQKDLFGSDPALQEKGYAPGGADAPAPVRPGRPQGGGVGGSVLPPQVVAHHVEVVHRLRQGRQVETIRSQPPPGGGHGAGDEKVLAPRLPQGCRQRVHPVPIRSAALPGGLPIQIHAVQPPLFGARRQRGGEGFPLFRVGGNPAQAGGGIGGVGGKAQNQGHTLFLQFPRLLRHGGKGQALSVKAGEGEVDQIHQLRPVRGKQALPSLHKRRHGAALQVDRHRGSALGEALEVLPENEVLRIGALPSPAPRRGKEQGEKQDKAERFHALPAHALTRDHNGSHRTRKGSP